MSAPPGTQPEPGGARFAFIDCLRAYAVVLVFLTHATEMYGSISGGGGWLATLAHRFDFGRVGVVVFFAVSGFVIPSSLRGEVAEGERRFLLSRLFRLFPAFWVSIPLAALTQQWLMGQPAGAGTLLLNATMLPRLFGARMVNGAYWTLEVELAFYLLCAALFAAGLLRRGPAVPALALFLALVVLPLQHLALPGVPSWLRNGDTLAFLVHLSIMLWGATCRRLWQGERLGRTAALLFWAYTGYFLLLRPAHMAWSLLFGGGLSADSLRWYSGYCGAMWIFAATVFLLRPRDRLSAWIGRISYSFYLLHGSVIYALLLLVRALPPLSGAHMAVYLVLAFLLTLLASAASYRFVEAPCIAYGRALARQLIRPLRIA